jgi:chromosome segregation ATPase
MEELDELREQLVGARAEAARLTEEAAERAARAEQLTQEMGSLRQELETVRLEATQARTGAAEESRRLAERFRSVLLQTAPEVPPEMVQGDNVDELDHSLAAARQIVARVREQVQTQTASRVPAGSPVRSGVRVDSLSPAEKIRLGVAEQRDQ